MTDWMTTDPASLAQQSLGLGAIGVGLQSGSQFVSGLGQASQLMYQSEVASRNAAIMRQNAQRALEAGQYNESMDKLQYGKLEAHQHAAQAANGVDVGTGSTVAVRNATALSGALDAAMIHFNAEKEAYAMRIGAMNAKTQSGLDRMGAIGSVLGGAAAAGASYLGGAASLADKWHAYQREGNFFPKGGDSVSDVPAASNISGNY